MSVWGRISDPVSSIGVSLDDLANMDDGQLRHWLLSNLLPQEGEKAPWRRLWAQIRHNDEMAHRLLDIMEDLLDEAHNTHVESDSQKRRRDAFIRRVDAQWRKIDKDDCTRTPRLRGPLAWTGGAVTFGDSAARVINELVQAIAEHRDSSPSPISARDRQLWRVLDRLHLDPRYYALQGGVADAGEGRGE